GWPNRPAEGNEPALGPLTEGEALRFSPNQENPDYRDLLTQERARNNYLLRELENYEDWYARSFNRGLAEEDPRRGYSGRRDDVTPDLYYRIDDNYRSERRS